MRALLLVSIVSLPVIAAADPPKKKIKVTDIVQPVKVQTPASKLGDAVASGKAKAVAKLLHVPFEYTGMHGDDAHCNELFGDHGTVKRTGDLNEFAACLIGDTSRLQFVDRVDGDEDPPSPRAVDVYAKNGVIT